MIYFEMAILLLTVFGCKKISWIKYMLIVNTVIWVICLQSRLQEPGAIGYVLLELILILISDLFCARNIYRQRKEAKIKL